MGSIDSKYFLTRCPLNGLVYMPVRIYESAEKEIVLIIQISDTSYRSYDISKFS